MPVLLLFAASSFFQAVTSVVISISWPLRVNNTLECLAVDLLKQGFFASFFSGMGRLDLARAAEEAARFPDADRGLDQLLARLPTQVLQPPKVKAEPTAISLGVVPMGSDRNLDLHLSNLGMRLAYGSVVSDCKWLTLGEGQGAGQKLFQFRAETIISVHVKGQFLRAGNQPLEGHLVVDSGDGAITVTTCRARCADHRRSPGRSVGRLVHSSANRGESFKGLSGREAAPALFEKGLVTQWFTTNGWTYPVQGPTVAGLGGVQQFFEALGLAKAPKVELKTPSIHLRGGPGQTLNAAIDVGTPEKKHVFAFAVSDKPWVIPGTGPKQGKGKSPTMATIPLTIHVPGAPGQVLQAKITVTANGNQKFPVPLTLTVSGSPGDYVPLQAIPLPAGAAPAGAVPIMATPVMATPIMAQPIKATPVMATPVMATPIDNAVMALPAVEAKAADIVTAQTSPAAPFGFPAPGSEPRPVPVFRTPTDRRRPRERRRLPLPSLPLSPMLRSRSSIFLVSARGAILSGCIWSPWRRSPSSWRSLCCGTLSANPPGRPVSRLLTST